MADAFQVFRPIAGKAPTATGGRATFAPPAGLVAGFNDPHVAFNDPRVTFNGEAMPPVETIGPIADVAVHVAFCYYPEDVPVARYDIALYDVDAYAGPPTCEDVSCNMRSYSSNVGRDLPLERFRTGTATLVLDDPDGRYSPWRTAGVPETFSGIRPGIDVEVWVEVGPWTYPRFTGRVTKIRDLFKTTGHHEVAFDCADGLSLLAAYDGVEQSPVGAGETSGTRIARIADNAGYDRPRRLDAGAVTLQATTLAKNALDEAGLVCDTELGVLFCDQDGTLVHRDRNALVDDPHYTQIQATFGEVEPELCYQAITPASDTDKVKNVVSIAPEGGTAVTLEDTRSSALYGRSTYRRFDLIHDDPAQSAVIAGRHLDFYAYAANRIEQLEPVVNADTLVQLLPLFLLSRIQVRRRAEGFQIVADLQIEAIKEQITPKTWTLEYTTFSADAVFDVGRYDVDNYDTALYGY
jgi:hypothetical protein